MIIRQAKPGERGQLFKEAYKIWNKNRTFEQYCADNGKEDAYGTRYVLEHKGRIVSSLILLNLKELYGCKVYGFGSVLTSPAYTGNGYATKLLKYCIGEITDENKIFFLYSEINPEFYGKLDFRVLPPHLQKDKKAICMVLCGADMWKQLVDIPINLIPDYF
ncbi:MAG: GNAT family N-acetyltransferase [Anaerocolumna sp.]